MKSNKIWVILAIMLLFCCISCCKPKNSQPSETIENLPYPTKITGTTTRYYSIAFVDHNVSGIHYRIFTTGDGAVSVVNVTKDSLEIKELQR